MAGRKALPIRVATVIAHVAAPDALVVNLAVVDDAMLTQDAIVALQRRAGLG
jgi:hypothetical protein